MVPCNRPAGWLLIVLVTVLAACSSQQTAAEPTAAPVTDTDLLASVSATFAVYRSAVVQGDGDAAVGAIDEASRDDMARIADIAVSADEPSVRALPAAEQLLVLTYRLRPDLLDAEDPYAALVDAGLGGQDRSLGDLGEVTSAGTGLALGTVTDPTTGVPTPLRWRFVEQDDAWRFDLITAHQLLSQAIANGATRAGVGVDDLVTATVVDLSGEDAATVEALYTEPPSAS